MSRLRFAQVRRRFGRHEVLRGVDLEVAGGERVLLLGSNGAGKTTLLRLAAGLLRPTEGQVTCDGRPCTTPEGRRGMGFVAQEAPTYAELSPVEHLEWWGRMHGKVVDGTAWAARAGLRRVAHERASGLSRGQRQRLSIAMALSTEPTLLLLDEPTTALDAAGRAWLEQSLEESRAAMLVAAHDDAWSARLGMRRVRLRAGRLTDLDADADGPERREPPTPAPAGPDPAARVGQPGGTP